MYFVCTDHITCEHPLHVSSTCEGGRNVNVPIVPSNNASCLQSCIYPGKYTGGEACGVKHRPSRPTAWKPMHRTQGSHPPPKCPVQQGTLDSTRDPHPLCNGCVVPERISKGQMHYVGVNYSGGR